MTLDASKLALLGLLSGCVYWLVARSAIARPLWSRARGRLDTLLRCAACCGVWLGLGCGGVGLRPVGVSWLSGMPTLRAVAEVVLTGILGVFATPVTVAVVLWAKDATALPDPPEPPPPEPQL